jgi:tellurite resistance-related uncharacterized protein
MKRSIIGFHRDDDRDWVADLDCGHTQHVRHRPPQENREWVTSEAGRASKIGAELDCLFCDMPEIPKDAAAYHESRVFDEGTIPDNLKRDHRTKAGVWGRIVVESGRLAYTLGDRTWVLRAGVDGHIPPDTAHHVEPVGEVRFKVVFLR